MIQTSPFHRLDDMPFLVPTIAFGSYDRKFIQNQNVLRTAPLLMGILQLGSIDQSFFRCFKGFIGTSYTKSKPLHL